MLANTNVCSIIIFKEMIMMLKVKSEFTGELYPMRMGWCELAEVLMDAYRFHLHCRIVLAKQDKYGYHDAIVGTINGYDSDSLFVNGYKIKIEGIMLIEVLEQ